MDYTRGATHENQTRLRLAFFLKHIAIIAVPVALQNLLTTTGSREDTMMLSSLGEKTVGPAMRSVSSIPTVRCSGMCWRTGRCWTALFR
ncbi:MAG: hypothetical protein HFH94_09215, partial [Lachnospiraceae bacterium]|nr:hypothetical protein [Lachnospiraceae bacterium]